MVRKSHFGGARLFVVIPTHNRERLVDEAIASVLQSPLVASPEHVVMVDDDSSDHPEAVARRYGIRYLRVNHRNASLARNAGFALADTPYVTFLDDDDVWLPGNMAPQLAALDANPDAAFAFGIARCATVDLQPLDAIFPKPPLACGLAPDRLHVDYPNLGVVLFRREAVLEAGGFDPRIRYHQDADLMVRIAARHEIIGVETVGMLYRLRPPSKSGADYFWSNREVTRWHPHGVGVSRKAAAQFQSKMRSILFHRFCYDASACIAAGNRRDAIECLSRAMLTSPARALRHPRRIGSLAWDCLRRRATS